MSSPAPQMQWNAEHQRWAMWNGQQWVWATPPVPAAGQLVAVQRGPTQSVHYEKQPMAHTFHLIMTILTAGLWGLFVWLPLGLIHSVSRGRRVTTKYR